MDESADPGLVRRVRPTESGTERQTLTQMLDFLRATVVTRTAGLSDEQALTRSVPASELTIASLVKHLTGTERFWFSIDFAGLDVPWPWTDDDTHGNFPVAPGDTLASLVSEYEAESGRSRAAIAGAALDEVARSDGMDFTLRYALVHRIEETARHCGHLDLLRESIDGARGQGSPHIIPRLADNASRYRERAQSDTAGTPATRGPARSLSACSDKRHVIGVTRPASSHRIRVTE